MCSFRYSSIAAAFLIFGISGFAQNTIGTAQPTDNTAAQSDSSPKVKTASADTQPNQDPLKRPLTDKQKKENQKALKGELSKTYKKWLDEDVGAGSSRMKSARLSSGWSNDEERDQFIEQFWLRRDPTPDTVENEFKEEHYRRIAYANEHSRIRSSGLENRSRPHIRHVWSAG